MSADALTRRRLLALLGAGLAGCAAKASAGDDLAQVCGFEGATVPAVVGPFAPEAFRPMLRGRPNPGERMAIAEHDMDLTRVEGLGGVPKGQIVVVRGRVMTAGCRPVAGAKVQMWQADRNGYYNHENERRTVKAKDLDPAFGYWGEGTTGPDGRFTVRTIVPGAYPADVGWWRPPHLHWQIAARGLQPVTTQSFFDGDVLTGIRQIRAYNEADLILNIKDGFEGGLRGAALDTARRRLRAEMMASFVPGDDGIPVGELVFQLDG